MIKHGEHVSRLYELRLCAGYFFDFFPFSRCQLRYFVLSALDIGEYKRFDGNICRNLRKLYLLFCYVNKHDFDNTIQYNTLFNHATFRSEKRSLKHVRAKTMYTINTIQYIQFIKKNIYTIDNLCKKKKKKKKKEMCKKKTIISFIIII